MGGYAMLGRFLRSLLGCDSHQPSADGKLSEFKEASSPDGTITRGHVALEAGRAHEAVRLADGVIESSPTEVGAHMLRGRAMTQLARLQEAHVSFDCAVRLEPDNAQACLQLGIAEHRLSQFDIAFNTLAKLIDTPQVALQANLWFSDAAVRLGRYTEAATSLERYLSLDPGRPEIHASLALILLRHLERPDDALVHSRLAIQLAPGLPIARLNHALVLQGLGQFDEALDLYASLVGDEHCGLNARLNSSLIRLGDGVFGEAWDDYEARRELDDFPYGPAGIPDWQGEPPQSRTIVAYGEQGLGDEIMFASCIPDLLRVAPNCIVECSPRLEALFKRSFPEAVVRATVEPGADRYDDVDLRVAFGSLPRYFRRRESDFPRHAGYLEADADRQTYWVTRLEEAFGDRTKIGISWRGGLAHTRRSLRSVSLSQLRHLLDHPNMGFVSLQYGDCQEEIARFEAEYRTGLQHFDNAIADYDETAALVSSLDLVITVCTAVAHLAGSLGKPVWVMVPSVPEWRYMHAGDKMPWYPTMRLLRSPCPREWTAVIEQIVRDLEE